MGRPKLTEIIGNRYSSVTVIGRSDSDSRAYECVCDCGKVFSTMKQRLENGRTKSCGCLRYELLSAALKTHGASSEGKNSPEYQSFTAMIHRCYTPSRTSYERYGGRGIIVSEESWLEESPNGFLNFLKDMGKRPDGTSLDRIDTNGNYCRDNCRWTTLRIQAVNTDRKKKEHNTSKYRGVSLRKTNGKYMARIGNGLGGYEWLGDYTSESEAALAYNKRALELFGEDAFQNKVE